MDSEWRGGYINANGVEVIAPQYASVEPFSEGLAAVTLRDRSHGYIDEQGRLVIGPNREWVSCGEFTEGCAVVRRNPRPNERWNSSDLLSSSWLGPASYIDRAGRYITERWFRNCAPFSEGLGCAGDSDHTTKYIDKTGTVVLTHPTWAGEFAEGLAAATQQDSAGELRWGCIDRQGKWVIAPREEYVPDPFSEGLMMVLHTVNGEQRVKFIDHQGRTVVSDYLWVGDRSSFSEGLAVVKTLRPNSRVVYIDHHGKIVIDLFGIGARRGRSFSEGIAAVDGPDGWGYISRNGKLVVPMVYDEGAGPFTGGLGFVMYTCNGHLMHGYVDRRGSLVYSFGRPKR